MPSAALYYTTCLLPQLDTDKSNGLDFSEFLSMFLAIKDQYHCTPALAAAVLVSKSRPSKHGQGLVRQRVRVILCFVLRVYVPAFACKKCSFGANCTHKGLGLGAHCCHLHLHMPRQNVLTHAPLRTLTASVTSCRLQYHFSIISARRCGWRCACERVCERVRARVKVPVWT